MSTDDKNLIRIAGRVVGRTTNLGLDGLRVEPWSKNSKRPEPFATAFTDTQGAFAFEFKKGRLKDFFVVGQTQFFFFKVFHGAELIAFASTEDSIIWRPEAPVLAIVIQVDDPNLKPLQVKGKVRLRNGTAVEDAIVRVVLTTPEAEISFGEDPHTDSLGQYDITSTDPSLSTSQFHAAG